MFGFSPGEAPAMTPTETATALPEGAIVRRLADAPVVPCPCGESTRLLTIADGPLVNFHVTAIRDAAKHFHRHTTELYYILEGTGTLELGEAVVPVEPGMLVVIPALVPHRLRSEAGVRTMVLGIPALDPDDEVIVEG
jgi:mannose-6-phosphate isomerase-like protein (cupin superfamily)